MTAIRYALPCRCSDRDPGIPVQGAARRLPDEPRGFDNRGAHAERDHS